jgi:hypothetical protein
MKSEAGSPYAKRENKITKKGFKTVEKSVKDVAKDTNKTRRPETRARLTEPTIKNAKPHSSLKKEMKKPINMKKGVKSKSHD